MTTWLGVVSADHVTRAVEKGIAQIGHGSRSGVTRMRPGDTLVYYSPRRSIGGGPLQSFTAIGRVVDAEVWQADEGDFRPWRRTVDYDRSARAVPLADLRSDLELVGGPNWGYQLRRGIIELSPSDARVIAAAMGADSSVGPR